MLRITDHILCVIPTAERSHGGAAGVFELVLRPNSRDHHQLQDQPGDAHLQKQTQPRRKLPYKASGRYIPEKVSAGHMEIKLYERRPAKGYGHVSIYSRTVGPWRYRSFCQCCSPALLVSLLRAWLMSRRLVGLWVPLLAPWVASCDSCGLRPSLRPGSRIVLHSSSFLCMVLLHRGLRIVCITEVILRMPELAAQCKDVSLNNNETKQLCLQWALYFN